MAKNAAVAAARFVVLDLVGDIIAFPLWWYTAGFVKFIGWAGAQASVQWQSIGVGVWLRNLFVPMFGQADVWGRIISFFLRLGQVIVRSVWYAVFLLLLAVLAVAWAVFPPALAALLFLQMRAFLMPAV